LGKYVDILISQKYEDLKKKTAEYPRESLIEGRLTSLRILHTSAEGAGPTGGQPQTYRRVNDIRKFGVVNEGTALAGLLPATSAFGLAPESVFSIS
jgi:hypothetical protein